MNITVKRHSQILLIRQFHDLFIHQFILKILIIEVAIFSVPLISNWRSEVSLECISIQLYLRDDELESCRMIWQTWGLTREERIWSQMRFVWYSRLELVPTEIYKQQMRRLLEGMLYLSRASTYRSWLTSDVVLSTELRAHGDDGVSFIREGQITFIWPTRVPCSVRIMKANKKTHSKSSSKESITVVSIMSMLTKESRKQGDQRPVLANLSMRRLLWVRRNQ